MASPPLKAVIFDIGGVVARSPFVAIAAYERKHNIPDNYLNCSIVARGSQGAWQRFERGELPLLEFYKAWGEDLSDTVNGNKWYTDYCRRKGIEPPKLPTELKIDARELFGDMMRESAKLDPHIVRAIHRIRATGRYKVIALTNNYASSVTRDVPAAELAFLGWQNGPVSHKLVAMFDDFCDSSTLGMRKPEPQFYLLACKRNGIRPQEAIFLDDIGMNLKVAKWLGMETIHVPIGGTLDAVKQLERRLGLDLTTPEGSRAKL
ncbi:HAD-like domain-containing protein [Schizophyllum fasciatum]